MRVFAVIGVVIGLSQPANAQAVGQVSLFEPPDGAFRIQFPCTPIPQPQPVFETGVVTRVDLRCEANDLYTAIVEVQVPLLPADMMLATTQKNLIARAKGQVLREDRRSISGYPAVSVVVAAPPSVLINWLVVAVPESRRVYAVQTVTERSNPREGDVRAFLDSFTVLKAPAPGAVDEAVLTAFASGVNNTLPRRTDADTELTNMSAIDGVLISYFRLVNYTAAQIDVAKMRAQLTPIITKGQCTSGPQRMMLAAGVTLRSVYSDRDLKMITEIDVTAASCAAAGVSLGER